MKNSARERAHAGYNGGVDRFAAVESIRTLRAFSVLHENVEGLNRKVSEERTHIGEAATGGG